MLRKLKNNVLTAQYCVNGSIEGLAEQSQYSSRATRLVDDSTRFLLLSLPLKLPDTEIRRILKKWVHEGVTVASARYAFFGFTENHVKEGRVICFREDESWTVRHVKEQFGDLDEVYQKHGYGKYAARLGLSFSSTVQSLDVAPEEALEVPDLRAPDGSLHTDGCGMICDSFAAEICHAHELPADTTVFQVRRGGIKGLLVRYPDDKFAELCAKHRGIPTPPSIKMAYRPSMLKYSGGPTALELNDCSRCPTSARLNAQFIIMLLTLGINIETFEKMLKEHLDIIGCITHDRDVALRYLKGELDASDHDTFGQDVYALLLAYHDLSEPYVEWKLKQFQALQYKSLYKKLNLRVEESCYVYGVVDEDGILEGDEVFINLPGRTGVVLGNVLVARNPSYSPGDFRKLRAVHDPRLKHHKHCIVFSRKASHSIPDSMASGDLDGDEYFVTWDPTLIPSHMATPHQRALPASATRASVSPTRITRQCTLEEAAIDTFIENAFSRLLGKMANSWSILAEATPQLANFTLPLVHLLESAHDIMKLGGNVAKLNQDFDMAKRALDQKKSAQAIGFRSPVQRLRDQVPQVPDPKIQRFDCDPALILEKHGKGLWDKYLREAEDVMSDFNEALSVAIHEDKKNNTSDGANISSRKKLGNQTHAERVKQTFRAKYFGGSDSVFERCKQTVRASAWYYYGYCRERSTFAWLGEAYLNEIRAHSTNGGKPVLYVGASGRKSSTLAQAERVASLAAKTETRAGAGTPQSRPTVGPPLQLTSREREVAQTADPPAEDPLSVRHNPKPLAPVATADVPSCPSSNVHGWKVSYANGYVRRYKCQSCGLAVGEKKNGDFWRPDFMEAPCDIREPDNVDVSLSQRSSSSTIDAGGEEDAKANATGKTSRKPLSAASSAGTLVDIDMRDETSSCAPSSIASDIMSSVSLRSLRRSLGLYQPEVHTQDGIDDAGCASVAAARTSSVPASRSQAASTVSELRGACADQTPLIDASVSSVAQNPKPRQPVATKGIPACRLGTHTWGIRANGGWRRYKCECGTIVTERKSTDGARWISC